MGSQAPQMKNSSTIMMNSRMRIGRTPAPRAAGRRTLSWGRNLGLVLSTWMGKSRVNSFARLPLKELATENHSNKKALAKSRGHSKSLHFNLSLWLPCPCGPHGGGGRGGGGRGGGRHLQFVADAIDAWAHSNHGCSQSTFVFVGGCA